MSMAAYPEGAWPVTTPYPAQYQQHTSNAPAYGTPEYTVYYTYWNSPAGLAIRQRYDASAYAQNAQQYGAAAQLNATSSHDAAPPLPAENLAPQISTPSGQHAPAGSTANAAKPEPPVPGQEAAAPVVEIIAGQPPPPQPETCDPSRAPMPTPQQATPYIVNQYATAPGAANNTAAAYTQYNSAGQYGVSQQQQQYARQAAWSTLTLEQQQQYTYQNQSSMQQAAYAPHQQAYQMASQPQFMAGQQQQAYQHLHNQAMPGYVMPALGAASQQNNVVHPSSMYPGWSAPSSSQPPHQQQQHPQYNHPHNSQPTHAPAPPASAGMIIRPQWAKQAPPPVTSHQSTFPPPSVPIPQHRPTAYTQVSAAKPPTPFTGLPAAPFTHIHTQRVPLAAPSTPAPLTPTAGKPTPVVAGPQPPKTGMGKFPSTFPPYVERCFARCKLDDSRALMTVRLQRKIQDVETAGRLWLVDWDTEAPPSLGPEAPVLAAAATNGSPHATGQQKRRWDRETEHAHPSPARSRFGDVKGETGDNKDRRKLGYGPAPDSHAHHYEPPPNAISKKQKKAAMAAERARGTFINPSQAAARTSSTAFTGPGRLSSAAAAEDDRRQQRSGRFKDGRAIAGGGVIRSRRVGGYSSSSDEGSDSELDLTDLAIKGTCTDLEKSYFRLTAAPDPYLVRPESVLKAAYARLLTLLATGNAGYFYACDQLKGMRQDLTVQRIRSPLAVLIYEMHARSALEYGDFAEFNQCQTQLHTILYTGEGAGGCRGEFHAYMLLYQSVHARLGLNKALLHSMQAVTPELAATRAVEHALQVRQAMMQENYAAFFRLYSTATGLGRAIMDVAVPKIRWAALNTLIKVYKTSLPVSLFAEVLGFVPRTAQPAVPSAALTPAIPLSPQPVAASAAPAPDTVCDSLQDATVQASASVLTGPSDHDGAVQQEECAAPVTGSLQDSDMRLNSSKPTVPDCVIDMETGPEARTVALDSVDDNQPAPQACTTTVPDSLHDSEMRETPPHDVAPRSATDVCDAVPAEVLLPGCIHVAYVGRFTAEGSTADGMAACVAWLTSHGAVLENAAALEPMVDVKLSVGQLKIPTEVSKVAHGDENLSLDDFLNRASMASAAR